MSDWKTLMKTEAEIRERLKFDTEQLDEWEKELAKSKNGFEPDDDYSEYCRGIIREYTSIVDCLKWILGEQ